MVHNFMRMPLIVLLIIFAVILGGCSKHPSSYNSLVSNGLGLSRTEWEHLYGSSIREDSGQSFYENETKRIIVGYWDGKAGFVNIHNKDGQLLTIEAARTESKKFIPSDAQLIRSFSSAQGNPVDL